jgi:hypothetical protein
MLRVPRDITISLGPKCAPVAQYKLPTNILTTQACEITKKRRKKTPPSKCKLTLTDGSNTSIYNKTYKHKYSRVLIIQHKQDWYVVELPKTSNNAQQITN